MHWRAGLGPDPLRDQSPIPEQYWPDFIGWRRSGWSHRCGRDGPGSKEYVAAQDPTNPGVFILSKFAGAAQQLSAALIVNPNDKVEVAEAIRDALHMGRAERFNRWQTRIGPLRNTTFRGGRRPSSRNSRNLVPCPRFAPRR